MLLTCRANVREENSFRYFLHHPRREQVEALNAGVVYDEGICKIARELYAKATKKQRGPCWVPYIRWPRMIRSAEMPVGTTKSRLRACPYYEALVVPGWQHTRWECPNFSQDRPAFAHIMVHPGWAQCLVTWWLRHARFILVGRFRASYVAG